MPAGHVLKILRRTRASWRVRMPTTVLSPHPVAGGPCPVPRLRGARTAVRCCLSTEQESSMMNASTARQRRFAPEQDEARFEFADELPPPSDWRSEARRALAPGRLGVDGDGRIVRIGGAPTAFLLDPLISGRQVYIRDEHGTRYWLGSPDRLRAVVSWLLS